MLLSNIFGIEYFVYYLIVLIAGIIPMFLCSDGISLLAPFAMLYSSFSLINKNQKEGKSIFLSNSGKINLIILIVLISIVLIGFLINGIQNRNIKKEKPKFLIGIIVFSAVLLLNALFSPYFSFENFRFALLEIVCLFGLYFYFNFVIDFEHVNKNYIFIIFAIYGIVLSLQVLNIYRCVLSEIDISDFSRGHIFTGWGLNNNIGGQLCICLASYFYLIYKNKYAILNSFISVFVFIATILTQSRAAILCGSLIYLFCFILTIVLLKKDRSLLKLIIPSITSFLIVVLLILFNKNEFFELYQTLIESLKNKNIDGLSSNRISLWKEGLKEFSQYPIFGTGFYHAKDIGIYRSWNFGAELIPPRYHNTIVQLLATGGILTLCAYIYHRFETIQFLLKNWSLHKFFVSILILGLLSTSLLDCHFFNLGPGLDYAILLIALEKIDLSKE